MKPLEKLGQVATPDGRDLILYRRDGSFQIRLDGLELMTSRAHGSEDALAELAQQTRRGTSPPRVLIGGLGMGFTLRAALDCFPPRATLVVAEVFAEVIAWNRGPLASLADHPLDDPRVRVEETDVAKLLGDRCFDVILLDVDNGPNAFTLETNRRLYNDSGIQRLARSLTAGGVLAVWSATSEPAFEKRLHRAGLWVARHTVRARGKAGGPRHTIYLASRESSSRAR